MSARACLFLLGLLLLAGCAAQRSYREGMDLMREGRYEEGVRKLEAANQLSPDNIEYRKDLLRAREQGANLLIQLGNNSRVAEQYDAAEQAYERARRVDPGNGRAEVGLQGVRMDRRHAAILEEARAAFDAGDWDGATQQLRRILIENPNHRAAADLQRQVNERLARDLTATPSLRASLKKPVTLQFRDANLRTVFEALSRTSGINVLLDRDVRADVKTSIFVKDTSVEDTIDLLLMQNQLAKKILSDNTIFIYPNLPAKTRDYQDLKVRTFRLMYADAKLMQTVLRTVLKTQDLVINEKSNSLVMRDTPDAIRLAEKIIADQDVPDPEVLIEVAVLEVSHSMLSELGIQWPDQVALTPQVTDEAGNVITGNVTLRQLKNAKDIIVSPVPSVTINAHLDRGDVNLLAAPRIRARNHEKAKIHIGDRVPVMTNSVTPVATGAPVVTGTVQYLDVGLKLDVQPDIHSDGEVGININMEVSNIVQQVTNAVSGSIAYQIGTRTAATTLRLKDGETQVLAGLIDDEDRKSANLVPGLGELPVLGRLFSSHHTEGKKTEIVLSITPRIVGRTHLQDANLMEFWSGTATSLRSSPLVLRQTGTVTLSNGGTAAAQPARPAGAPGQPPRPGVAAAPSSGAAGAPAPISFLWQGPAQAKAGDKFTLSLGTQVAEPLGELDLVISFDPAALKAVEATEGSFVKMYNSGGSFNRDISQDGGQITIRLSGTPEKGARGAGSLVSITFEAIGTAESTQVSLAQVIPSSVSGEPLAFVPPPPHSISLGAR
jgi:general secretion pathway protein D